MRLTIREVGLGLRRAPLLSALSIVTIAFSLFAFGLFGLVALNVSRALQDVEERVEIRAFISDGTPVEAVSAAVGDIAAFPEVAQVDILSPEQALARARRELTEFKDVFDADFLPASLEIRLKDGFRDAVHAGAVAQRVRGWVDAVDVAIAVTRNMAQGTSAARAPRIAATRLTTHWMVPLTDAMPNR